MVIYIRAQAQGKGRIKTIQNLKTQTTNIIRYTNNILHKQYTSQTLYLQKHKQVFWLTNLHFLLQPSQLPITQSCCSNYTRNIGIYFKQRQIHQNGDLLTGIMEQRLRRILEFYVTISLTNQSKLGYAKYSTIKDGRANTTVIRMYRTKIAAQAGMAYNTIRRNTRTKGNFAVKWTKKIKDLRKEEWILSAFK